MNHVPCYTLWAQRVMLLPRVLSRCFGQFCIKLMGTLYQLRYNVVTIYNILFQFDVNDGISFSTWNPDDICFIRINITGSRQVMPRSINERRMDYV